METYLTLDDFPDADTSIQCKVWYRWSPVRLFKYRQPFGTNFRYFTNLKTKITSGMHQYNYI